MNGLPFAFGSPWYLLLLVALPLIYWMSRHSLAGLSKARRISSITIRVIVLLLLVLSLAEFRFLKTNERLAVIFVVDLSESIPADRREAERQFVLEKAAEREQNPDDLVGVVAFGRIPGIEWSPKDIPLELTNFTTLIEPQATDVAAAIRLAAAAFPEGYGKRIVLLSDGNENTGSALEEIYNAFSQGVTVDVVPVDYDYPREILVEKLLVEPQQHIGEPFDLLVVVQSTHETAAILQLYKNGSLVELPNAQVSLKEGKTVFTIPGQRVDEVGRHFYQARVEPLRSTDDSVYQNNTAFGFTVVDGAPKVLVCTTNTEKDATFARALREETITFDLVTPEGIPSTIPEYLEYDAVILSNVPSDRLSEETMQMFESLVKTIGIGFVMLGGDRSFGAGGYQGSPIERLLPVEMDIKNKKVMPNGALGIVVHSCELSNGNWWARKVIQQALRILSPRDYAGIISYDNGVDQWLFKPDDFLPVSQRRKMLNRLQSFNPGDMMSFQNIMRMARDGLKKTPASIRHMIVFSDGDPAPPSPPLVASIRAAGITISTICYGAHGTVPAAMKQLAQAGGGKFYYLSNARDLPEIFIRETTTVTKSLISEERFTPLQMAGHPVLQGVEDFPALDGYVLTTPKELATQLLVHPSTPEDPTHDPVLALWSYGLGKSVAFTSDVGQRWGGDWVSWGQYRQFWSQVVRWVLRSRSEDQFRISRDIRDGEAIFQLDAFTPAGRFVSDLELEATIVTPDFENYSAPVTQPAPGRYEVRAPVSKQGAYLVTLAYEKDGQSQSYSTGLSVPYSYEYRRQESNHELLKKVADAGDGTYFGSPGDADFFRRDYPLSRDVHDVWHVLLLVALCLFFGDVFLRRVVVDYRRMLSTAYDRALVLVSLREPQRALSDGRLTTLLERKAQLREATSARYQSQADSSQAGVSRLAELVDGVAEEGATATAGDRGFARGGLDEFSSDEMTPSASPTAFPVADSSSDGASKKRPKPIEKPESSARGVGYTARLLKAKKRAIERDEDTKES